MKKYATLLSGLLILAGSSSISAGSPAGMVSPSGQKEVVAGSITKQFIAVAILKLERMGRLEIVISFSSALAG